MKKSSYRNYFRELQISSKTRSVKLPHYIYSFNNHGFSFNLWFKGTIPLPMSVRHGWNFVVDNQLVTNISNLYFSHFWFRKCNTLVKFTDNSLIISAVPFLLSDIFSFCSSKLQSVPTPSFELCPGSWPTVQLYALCCLAGGCGQDPSACFQ